MAGPIPSSRPPLKPRFLDSSNRSSRGSHCVARAGTCRGMGGGLASGGGQGQQPQGSMHHCARPAKTHQNRHGNRLHALLAFVLSCAVGGTALLHAHREPGARCPPVCRGRSGPWGARCTGGAGRAAPCCRPARDGPCPGRRTPGRVGGGRQRGLGSGSGRAAPGGQQSARQDRCPLPRLPAHGMAEGELKQARELPYLPAVGAVSIGQRLGAVGTLRQRREGMQQISATVTTEDLLLPAHQRQPSPSLG